MHALNPDQGATNEFVNGQSPIIDKLSIYSNKTRKQSTAKITSNDNTVNKHIEQLRGQKIKQTFRMNKICRNRPTPETVHQRATDKMQNSNNYDRRHRILIRQQLAEKRHERAIIKILLAKDKRNRSKSVNTRRLCYIQTTKHLLVRRLVRSAVAVRSRSAKILQELMLSFQNKMKILATNPSTNLTSETFHNLIGGERFHTSHSEPFFFDTAYRPLPAGYTLVLDEHGVEQSIHSIESGGQGRKGSKWSCGSTCLIREATLSKAHGFIALTANATKQDLNEIFNNIDECNNPARMPTLMGHSSTCIENPECKSSLRCLRELSTHYSGMRGIVKDIYPIKSQCDSVNRMDSALASGNIADIERLTKIMSKKQEQLLDGGAASSDDQFVRPAINEKTLLITHSKSLIRYENDMNSFHDTPCACCERLFQGKDLKCLSNAIDKIPIESDPWLMMLAYLLAKHEVTASGSNPFDSLHICHYCKDALNKSTMPPRCALNGLEVDPLPETMKDLNNFETMLLQKSKCFQTVIRLGPVKNRLPHSEMLKSVKGRVVYLPLPLEPNHNMLPKGLAPNHELHILVNGVPTKNKIVWQDIIRVHKVKQAMDTLIQINPLYANLNVTPEQFDEYIFGPSVEREQACPGLHPEADALLEHVPQSQVANLYQHYSIHPIFVDQPCKQLETY